MSNLCGFAEAPRSLPRIGIAPPSPIARATSRIDGRLAQCLNAGYTIDSPGPAACGCAEAFSYCRR